MPKTRPSSPSSPRFRGVIVPILTPFNDDLSVAPELWEAHAAGCLADGAHYLSPFGTTGEALSLSARERMEALERLTASGAIPPERLMPGSGLCSLEETTTLCRHAVDLGCAAVMVLPPFFYVTASDEGLYAYFSRLIESVASDALRMCLYHIPQTAGIGISPALAARLNAAFPETVVAYKDSSGNWDNTKAVIDAAPGISVFPGSEVFLVDALRAGGGGCISATCNSNVGAIRAVYDLAEKGDFAGAEAALPAVIAHRRAAERAGLIPALKSFKAHVTGERRWLNLRPPLLNADATTGAGLAETVGGTARVGAN
ncbi:dihydrodipicolinate synthase family protein [Roseovarius amoyensis]|uniref:dihydrodipicolinate synthase family protein n=1 Tax=Roseovarius amoyensis TaxID=2211448 RepID=UPI000DBE3254|nr:dihydrodipicolinate synthase family protein [Roseovarius amoyensis]